MALELHQRPGRGRRRSIRKAVVVVGVGCERGTRGLEGRVECELTLL